MHDPVKVAKLENFVTTGRLESNPRLYPAKPPPIPETTSNNQPALTIPTACKVSRQRVQLKPAVPGNGSDGVEFNIMEAV